ncbi:biotin-independent malonate decarboxylase subunit beta [Mesobacillus boroniphilus]|uniref:Biotin-independent malonate decarboxylase subunit beta n=1 Tax=Mesobacillus boroniphilus TaxID=308892 RepID=A0A944GVJ8_9BACI|nr:biotin-independent malonate decarboxylase subunit beta [Mesobacillus boroniphilus]MBS8263873.1 biotin-independent malonate decarboxylase subunit beta [Mesobacillus boroniphilus]
MLDTLKNSFTECGGRERARLLLTPNTFRELLDPFSGIESPHLEPQGIVPQSDDGVIIARGELNNHSLLVISIEGKFQGGGIGEVSGAKIAGALELALEENKSGNSLYPVLIFDTGGVRLQEANYGLLSIAEIGAAIVALREYVPVIGIIPGKIGAFGGMSITAGLCSKIIMTREARLGLNGPEVIEQEAGIEEFDSMDRQLIWNTIGGKQREAAGFADYLVEDDIKSIQQSIIQAISLGKDDTPKSAQVDRYLSFLEAVNTTETLTPENARQLWNQSEGAIQKLKVPCYDESPVHGQLSRGHKWFKQLTAGAENIGEIPSVLCADSVIGNRAARFLAIVPDETSRFPRARSGEFGIEQGWMLAKHIREVIEEDRFKEKRAIIAVVDVPSQAYGYREELLGIHQACAAAVDAYATARLAGHPVIAFIPGKAISGAFLSHGLQANRLIALDDEGVNVHVMSKQSAARITMRTIEELEEATKKVPAMAYDIRSFEKLGALHSLLDGVNADEPAEEDILRVFSKLTEAIEDIENKQRDLSSRLTSAFARQGGREASILVREKLAEQWN